MIFWTLQEAEGDLLGLLTTPNQPYLAEAEIQRCAQMKIEKRRREWVLGRMTAKALLTSEGLPFAGQPMNSLLIENHPEGAPYIANQANPGNLSISHRERVAAAAYTEFSTMQVGIDLEKIEPRAMSFVEDFFTQAEAAYTNNLSGEAQQVWITLVWSAKEAILKAWQKGLRLDTRSIEIQPVGPEHLLTRSDEWQPLAWQANISGFPLCWAGFRRWNEFILTLAYSLPESKNPVLSPDIHRVQLSNFPDINEISAA